jgi:hypothetical protein
MALPRHDLRIELPHPVDPRQLSLFGQRGVTLGAVEASSKAIAAELEGTKRPLPATRFPIRPGCPLCCDCEQCLQPSSPGLASTSRRR